MINKLKSCVIWLNGNPGKSGAIAGWTQQATSAAVAVLMVPVLTRFLSTDECGLWFAFQGMVAIAGLANFGIGQVIARQTAFSLGSTTGVKERSDFLDLGHGVAGVRLLNKYTNIIYIAIVILAVLMGVFLYEIFIQKSNLLSNAVKDYRTVWYIILSTSIVLAVGSRDISFLIGAGYTHFVKILATIHSLVLGITLTVIVCSNPMLELMALGSLFVGIAYVGALRLLSKRLILEGEEGVKPIELSILRRIVRISFPLGVVNIGGFLFSSIQAPIVGAFLGPALVTPFYLVQKLAQFVVLGCQQSLQPQLPKFTRLIAANDWNSGLNLLKKSFGVYLVLVLFGALFFVIFSPAVIGFMTNSESSLPESVIILMGLDLSVLAITMAMSHAVMASGRNPFMLPTLIGGILNLFLIMKFIPHIGMIGLPLSTLLSGVLTTYAAGSIYGWRLWKEMRNHVAR